LLKLDVHRRYKGMLELICHVIIPKPVNVVSLPDTGTTSVLLSIAIGSMAFLRAKLRVK
jgi:hypothetical protein